jgi:hypothetical protein
MISFFILISFGCFRIIERLSAALRLLHHFATAPSTPLNLRTKLQACQFSVNGVHHMFVIAIGRLAFADPPDWMVDEKEEGDGEKKNVDALEACSGAF